MLTISKTVLLVMSFVIVHTFYAQTQTPLEIAMAEYEKIDKELNSVWKKLMPYLNKEEKAKLRAEQKEWITMKEQLCQQEANKEFGDDAEQMQGSSWWSILNYECLTKKTKERLAELQKLLKLQTNKKIK